MDLIQNLSDFKISFNSKKILWWSHFVFLLLWWLYLICRSHLSILSCFWSCILHLAFFLKLLALLLLKHWGDNGCQLLRVLWAVAYSIKWRSPASKLTSVLCLIKLLLLLLLLLHLVIVVVGISCLIKVVRLGNLGHIGTTTCSPYTVWKNVRLLRQSIGMLLILRKQLLFILLWREILATQIFGHELPLRYHY